MDLEKIKDDIIRLNIKNVVDYKHVRSTERFENNTNKDILYIVFNKFDEKDQLILIDYIDNSKNDFHIFPLFIKD